MSDVQQEGGPRGVNTVVRPGRRCSAWTGSRSPRRSLWVASGSSPSRRRQSLFGCIGCGARAKPHARRTVRLRDLPIGGRPVVLCWRKRIWRCRDHGRPLVEDPDRLEGVAALGLDETSFLRATRTAPTRWVTGLVDLDRGRLLDLVPDRTRGAVNGRLGARLYGWLAQVGMVALDPWRGYASALTVPLGHATVVVDHFHAVRLANMVVDQTRRRTPAGHPGPPRPHPRPAVPDPQAAPHVR
jgi:transposase